MSVAICRRRCDRRRRHRRRVVSRRLFGQVYFHRNENDSWGILICYEGVYPWTLGLGDFSEMQGMVEQGATAFVWSIGGFVPPATFGKKMASKFGVY